VLSASQTAMHALQKLFFLKWCTCNFLIRLKSIAARLRARSLSLFIIRRCLTVPHWARCGCSDFCSFLSQVRLSRRPAVRLFSDKVQSCGQFVSEKCNCKYSYLYVPVIRAPLHVGNPPIEPCIAKLLRVLPCCAREHGVSGALSPRPAISNL
jgi:hypothetical protein